MFQKFSIPHSLLLYPHQILVSPKVKENKHFSTVTPFNCIHRTLNYSEETMTCMSKEEDTGPVMNLMIVSFGLSQTNSTTDMEHLLHSRIISTQPLNSSCSRQPVYHRAQTQLMMTSRISLPLVFV